MCYLRAIAVFCFIWDQQIELNLYLHHTFCQISAYPDGYFFGTQNLFCLYIRMRDPPSRFPFAISHRLIYYRNAVYEFGPSGIDTHSLPDWKTATNCPVTWESTPAGNSTCSVQSLKEFLVRYSSRYGSYKLLANNCHKFANRVVAFLFNSNCGLYLWQNWRTGGIKPTLNINCFVVIFVIVIVFQNRDWSHCKRRRKISYEV